LRRVVPEALKPRKITIGTSPAAALPGASVQPAVANDSQAAIKAA
jgi:hypothetical protein